MKYLMHSHCPCRQCKTLLVTPWRHETRRDESCLSLCRVSFLLLFSLLLLLFSGRNLVQLSTRCCSLVSSASSQASTPANSAAIANGRSSWWHHCRGEMRQSTSSAGQAGKAVSSHDPKEALNKEGLRPAACIPLIPERCIERHTAYRIWTI
jgi:hypothetical protein